MFDKLMKMFGQRVEPKAQDKKQIKPKKTDKELATEKGEPFVSVVKVSVDKSNPRYGSFELDWNSYFVRTLTENGYKGDKDEEIVDQWFQDVCCHVVLETYEQEQANVDRSDNIVRYINRQDLGDGRSEVS